MFRLTLKKNSVSLEAVIDCHYWKFIYVLLNLVAVIETTIAGIFLFKKSFNDEHYLLLYSDEH